MKKTFDPARILTICTFIILTLDVAIAGEKPEIFVQMGHTKEVARAVFSPDGKYVLSGSSDNTMKLWDVATGRELRTFNGPTRRIVAVALSQDGKYAVSGDEDFRDNLKLWDIATGKLMKSFSGHPGTEGTTCVAFTPDGKSVLSGGDSTVKLWDIASGKMVRTLFGNSVPIREIVLSPDGKYVVSGCRSNVVTMVDSLNPDGSVYESYQARATSKGYAITVWDLATGRIVRRFNEALGWVESLAMSPNGKFVISGDFEDSVRVWDFASGRQLESFYTSGTSAIAISPDSKYALFGGVMEVSLWNIATGAEVQRIKELEGWVRSVAFSSDKMYSQALTADDSKSPKLWDIATSKRLLAFGGKTQQVASVSMSSDGKTLFVAQNSNFIHIWDIASGRKTETIRNSLGMTSTAVNSAGTTVGAGGWDFAAHSTAAKFWNTATGKETSVIKRDGSYWVQSLCISPDQMRVLWTTGPDLVLSDLSTGKPVRTFSAGRSSELTYAAMSLNEKYAVASNILQANIWDVATGAVLKTFSQPGGMVSVSSNGKTVLVIAMRDDGNVSMTLWDFQANKEIVTRPVDRRMISGKIVLSPDGKFAVVEEQWNLSLWDLARGKELKTFSGHTNSIATFGMSPDGRYLYSGSSDGTSRLWDIATGNEIARFVGFTDGEWVVITPEGYFNASSNGAQRLNVRIGNDVYSIDNFYEKFYNPAYVASVLRGKKEQVASDIRKGFALPPLVKIIAPKPNTEFQSDAVTITVSAKDMGGGIDEIRLFQNGKLVSGDQRGMKMIGTAGRDVTKSYQLTLLPGTNTFRAIALNPERTESNPDELAIELKAAEAKSDLYLFVIGINEYKNGKYNLNYGKSDATAFLNSVLQRSGAIFKRAVQYHLYDGEAVRPAIEATFGTIAASAKPQDAFVFYYAGHGVMSEGSESAPSDFYLIPADVTRLYGDDAMLASKAISAAELKTLCTSIKAQKQLVVLDACQSGGAVASFAMRGASEERAIVQLARSAGTILLASTGTEQFATEFSALSHGIFTYALLQGLNGEADGGNPKDGKITVKELEAYLNDRVPELTKQYRGTAQYPNSYARGQDFPLGMGEKAK